MGAIRSKGERCQYELTGVYHCNYLQDVEDKRIQDEQPFSIILALDELQFQYKNAIMDEEVERVCVPIGYVATFSSALSIAEGITELGIMSIVCLLMIFWMRWITPRGLLRETLRMICHAGGR